MVLILIKLYFQIEMSILSCGTKPVRGKTYILLKFVDQKITQVEIVIIMSYVLCLYLSYLCVMLVLYNFIFLSTGVI